MVTVAFYNTKPYDREYFGRLAGDHVRILFYDFGLEAATAETAKGAEAVCVFVNDRVDGACLRALKEVGVRHVALRCAGWDNVEVEAAKQLGMTVTRVPAYSPHAVAEHALALLMTLNRKTHRAHNRVRELNFGLAGLVGWDLHGKTVGLVGTGKIGRIAAGIFGGLGMEVLAHDKMADVAWARSAKVSYVGLEELWKRSDVISLHAPLTEETTHMLDAKAIAQMKQGVTIINTSRGKLIDTLALVDGLKSGKLGAVGLDVYEGEAGVFYEDHSGEGLRDEVLSRLITFPNVLITAHQSFLTHEALTQIASQTIENVKRLGLRQEFLAGSVV